MKKIIAITGPTASGKSAAALEICGRIGGEIISCDSMQIYRGMDIGTAKPTREEQAAVRHHMIDVADPSENYSCADYVSAAKSCIEDVLSRGGIPVVCGGTGMYFERLFVTSPLASPPSDPDIRAELEARSSEENYAELTEIDPASAAAVHMNNRKRVIRAIEIFRCSGRTKTEWDEESRNCAPQCDVKHFTLVSSDRELLYRRIDRRVDLMMDRGLPDEVRSLPLSTATTAGQAIGYKEMIEYIDGGCTLDEAVRSIKQNSRNYAKRQLTWFRRYKDAYRLDTAYETCDNIVNFIISIAGRENM